MKTVFSNPSDIAHIWANQTQNEARYSGGNFFFREETIYSYGHHFAIAKHIKNVKGEHAILFTKQSYSNTTAKHISITKNACSHKNIIMCTYIFGTHEDNFKEWLSELQNILSKLKVARKPEKYFIQIEYINSEIEKYSQFFGVEVPDYLASAMTISDSGKLAEYEEKLATEKAKKHAEQLKKWRNFEIRTMSLRNGFDYLRFRNDRFETSQGVEIPKQVGLDLWEWVKETNKKGGCTKCNKTLLRYDITEVTKDYIKVGCHTISIKELKNARMNCHKYINKKSCQ